jgi:hypothetical protein
MLSQKGQHYLGQSLLNLQNYDTDTAGPVEFSPARAAP